MADWLTPDQVIAWARQDGTVSPDDASLTSCVRAATAWVQNARSDLDWTKINTDPATVPADVLLGSIMLAYRWYQRQGSPLGVAGYQDFGTQPILRHDPDIARLLGIGWEGRFVFAAGRRRVS